MTSVYFNCVVEIMRCVAPVIRGVNPMRKSGEADVSEKESISLVPVAEETAVRVLLFNSNNEVLLQKVSIPSKPDFYITPGGRLDSAEEDLLDAVRRELTEETGFEEFTVVNETPFFSGTHVMEKSRGPVKMTEHFFHVKLEESSHHIDTRRQSLTPEELEVFSGQQWMSIEEIGKKNHIIFPVNIYDIARAVLEGIDVPGIDFSDPPELIS